MFTGRFNGWIFFLHRGRVVLGYSEMEITMKGSGYNFIHAADMMYCADNHIRSTSYARFRRRGDGTDTLMKHFDKCDLSLSHQ